MNISIKTVAIFGAMTLALFSCEKEKEIFNQITETGATNGALKGKVTGFTGEDSTAFNFSFSHIYEEDWNDSYWEEETVPMVAKTSAVDGEVSIYVKRMGLTQGETQSYIYIENWDLSGDIADAYIEIYLEEYKPLNGQTLYYEHYAYDDDMTIHSASFDPKTGKFSIDLTATFDEDNSDGTTDNPGTISMSYSGTLVTDDPDQNF